MAAVTYLKGQKLFSFARKKATALGIDHNGVKMAELIQKIQVKEGHTACFRTVKNCSENQCCWQGSCGAVMGSGD